MSKKENNEIDPAFEELMESKNRVLMACGEINPIQALTLLTITMTDIIVNTANAKEYALLTADSIHEQLRKNIESFDDHGMAWWNKNIQ